MDRGAKQERVQRAKGLGKDRYYEDAQSRLKPLLQSFKNESVVRKLAYNKPGAEGYRSQVKKEKVFNLHCFFHGLNELRVSGKRVQMSFPPCFSCPDTIMRGNPGKRTTRTISSYEIQYFICT